jgi:YVTN family beta-propeller protein
MWVSGNDVWVDAEGPNGVTAYEINSTTNAVVNGLVLSGPHAPIPNAPQNASGTRAYVTDYVNNAISVYQTSDWTIVDSIPLGTPLSGLSPLESQGNYLYVVDWQNNIQVISMLTDQIVTTVPIASYTFSMAINPAGTFAYFGDSGGWTGSEISVMNTASNSVIAHIALPELSEPTKILVNGSGTLVYALDSNTNSVSVIDASTDTLITTVLLGSNLYPNNFALDSAPSSPKAPTHVTVLFGAGKSALSVADQRSLKTFAKSVLPGSAVTVTTYAFRDLSLCKVRANSIVSYLTRFARFHAQFVRVVTKKQNFGTVSTS